MSLTFALVALVVAAQNVVMAGLAALTIGLIIVNVIALVPQLGWELGSGESVAIVACIGFAVDFVVHLGSHYAHSSLHGREERVREALREMGISIASGSATTALAVLILFQCQVQIFSKFAIFVLYTVALSTTYSLCFFSALCLVLGPQGDYGSVWRIYGGCVRCCTNLLGRGRKRREHTEETVESKDGLDGKSN